MTQQTPQKPPNARAAALRVTAVYLVVGCLWIALSDSLLRLLVPDVSTYARISTYKGWFFVLGTALLIYFLVARALTRAQQAEKGQQESLASHRDLAESISDMFLSLDEDLRFTYWNQACAALTGLPAERVLGRGLAELFPELSGGPLEVLLRRVLQSGQAETMGLEVSLGGRMRYLEFRVYPAKRGLSLLARDLTGSRAAEEERRRLAAALEQAGEGVAIWDTELNVVYANPAYQRQHGQEREELLGQPPALLGSPLGPEIRRRVREQGLAWSGRVELPGRDGGVFLCEATVTPVRGQREQIINYVQVERDVTLEVERQRQLRRTQKMEAIGTLASGVAHDFNNILAAILGYTDLAAQELEAGHPVQSHLERVLKAGERARDLVKQILAFSRQAEQRLEPLDLGQVVRESLSLLRASLPSTIIMTPKMPHQPAMVLADPTEMHQVLMNLCANAAQAMGEQGGRLEVQVEFWEDWHHPPGPRLEPGAYVLLRVSDNGPGMAPEVRERIFEPFFTTKAVGEGTGLGLSVVHGIVKASGGVILVQTGPGQGTTFSVFLPRLTDALAQEVGSAEPEMAGQGERILVVDDERSLAELAGETLTRLGYRVRSTTSALEALALINQDPEAFDLVYSDQTMPILTGLELARRLHQLRPGLPVLLTTGFSDQLTPGNLEDADVAGVLIKPASAAEVARQVRQALGRVA